MSDAENTGSNDTSVNDESPATDGLTSEGGVWGVGDPKDEEMLANQTVTNDAVAGEPVDAAFIDVDEADVETSLSGDSMDSENDQHLFSNTHGEVEPGTDNQDTTTSQLTDALDSDALASSEAPATDETGSEN
ncbi:hypothetical protein [Mycetocola zhadangensis]|uniref:Uncharacterized protein n=1 Tax=Mycetocola zhadangensis TaxID=1164595 RepID=A0A3L7J1K9_9MICO|nr:hypothetical protein [Mycetocola zhadangensis]RLQ84135.1 hypothetical protein D9V28_07850 [Mycetocola zhadangensis]GGE95880.1 hypothetical protein GCM10011313_18500 [Mycetocola zhadangensis]